MSPFHLQLEKSHSKNYSSQDERLEMSICTRITDNLKRKSAVKNGASKLNRLGWKDILSAPKCHGFQYVSAFSLSNIGNASLRKLSYLHQGNYKRNVLNPWVVKSLAPNSNINPENSIIWRVNTAVQYNKHSLLQKQTDISNQDSVDVFFRLNFIYRLLTSSANERL